MSTCRGTWRDARVPGTVGVLATSNGVLFVVHEPRPCCDTAEPHEARECGEFLPPRWAPAPESPKRRVRYVYDWDHVFAALAKGQSMFAVLDQLSPK